MLSNQELKQKLDSLKKFMQERDDNDPRQEDIDNIFEVLGSTLEAIHDIAEFANQIQYNTLRTADKSGS